MSSSTVTNLGIMFDSNLSLDSDIDNIFRTAFFYLNCSTCCLFLMLTKLINVLNVLNVDYCSALLGGCPVGFINKLVGSVQQLECFLELRNMITSAKFDHLNPLVWI